jgi:hypothetical protein
MQDVVLPAGEVVTDTDLVLAAAHPRVTNDRKDVVFEVRKLESGRTAGIAFTSRRHLVEALGPSQPWVVIALGRFRELMGAAGVDDVAVNPSVSPDAVLWQPEDIEAFIAGEQA